MAGKYWMWGLLALAMNSTGCCSWCQRHCGTNQAAVPVAYAQPAPVYAQPQPVYAAPQQCVPICPPGTVARTGGYTVTGGPTVYPAQSYPVQAMPATYAGAGPSCCPN